MMKKYNYYLVFFLLMFFGQIQAGIYPNYTQNITVQNLNNNGQTGNGGGTISIINDILTISINATWTNLSYLKIGTVATLTISPALPNMELGQLSSVLGNPLSNYGAKIENNTLIFYLTNSPTQWNGCYLNFTKNLACSGAQTWYLDDDLDGLGDPLNFLTEQCTKPNGNYVLNNSDNCPTIPGTNANCNTLISVLQNRNSIKNITYKTETANSITNPTILQANQNITYFDGLGRPVQKNSYQSSATGKDIVTPIEYDDFGRQTKEYLPFASSQNNLSYIDPATLIPNLITQYQSNYGTINSNPFSEKQIEASPLGRVLQQAAPGNDWAIINNHTVKMDYQTNIDNDVKNYIANAVWNSGLGLFDISLNTGAGYYPANQLLKTVTYDENTTLNPNEIDGSTVEFKNKEGQIILKRTYDAQIKHDTYYVYDSYGNLTYVIPPKAVDLINNTTAQSNITSTAVVNSGSSLQLTATNSITLSPGFNAVAGSIFSATIISNQSTLDDLCYQYKYDYRNRLVEKKLPGKQWEFIVYDKLDRPVATGPSLSPFTDITSNGWNITKYDALNRPVITAWLPAGATSADRKILQDTQNTYTTNFNENKIAGTTNNTINGVDFRYTNVAWPISGYHVMTVSYFDDYNYPGAPTIPTTVTDGTQAVYYNTTTKPIGLATGSWIRILESSADHRYEQTYSLYDAKARPVRSYTKNFLDGYVCVDSKIEAFSGKLKSTITTHKRLQSNDEIKTTEVYNYSDQDRLLTQTHQIGTATPELIVSNTYDELGQLISKKVGNNSQKIDYTYNIRGWLTAINDVTSLTKPGDPKDLFAFKINYNNPNLGISGIDPLYNGNISETQWATNSDNGILRGYGYRYDKLNRLKEGIYKKGSILNNYNESLIYDKNGNIINLTRYGSTNDNSQTLIDQLTYDYKNSNKSNQLVKVTDAVANNSNFLYEFKDSASNAIDDYTYDANGNMISDKNKDIVAITYNHLNQPKQITFATTGNIVYLYNAAGQKVQKIVNTTGQTTISTDYLGGYQYENGAIKFFSMAEGYIEPAGSSYNYIYQYKDHLGNVRLSFDKTLAIKEESNYYPFGAKQEGYNSIKTGVENKYKYNGKELQDELGLNIYDYGARNYDPALGRWMNIDPLAEKSRRFSPYTYALNNPVFFIDPDGMEALSNEWIPDENGNLHAEAGDNKETLATFLGVKSENITLTSNNGSNPEEIKEGDVVTLNNVYTESIKNSTSDLTLDKALSGTSTTGATVEDNYNCWGSAIAGSQGNKIEAGVGIAEGKTFDLNLSTNYTETDASKAVFGKTVLRFADSNNDVQHGAVFYGNSKDGTTYVYSKNGWQLKPEVMKLSDLQTKIPSYGTVQGINYNSSGYYQPK